MKLAKSWCKIILVLHQQNSCSSLTKIFLKQEFYNNQLNGTVVFTGQKYTLEEAKEIVESTWERNGDLLSEWSDLFNNNTTPLPALPLRVLPRVTKNCVSGDDCYHVQYWIGDTDESRWTNDQWHATLSFSRVVQFSFFILAAALDHPYFIPCEMMQVFSLGLSSPLARPINIYGHFSVRDAWEPLRNYLFNRSRNDPAMISQVSDACSCPELKLCHEDHTSTASTRLLLYCCLEVLQLWFMNVAMRHFECWSTLIMICWINQNYFDRCCMKHAMFRWYFCLKLVGCNELV